MRQIKQGHVGVGGVPQLDVALPAERRMIHDFINDHGADAWSGVSGPQSQVDLRWKVFIACAVDVTTERNAIRCRLEAQSMTVAREVCVRIRG
jgi:hypothetical protein